MNHDFNEEVFTYYKEGVLTEIGLNGRVSREEDDSLYLHLNYSEDLRKATYESCVMRTDRRGAGEEIAWFMVSVEAYGKAGMEYWDTG
ncbi:hypothetical protein [Aneurinibacillus thermoaerophilus]|uniref:hypothetical protein n=1 Tax=Aneurinibacillus thermoaerophilus TaxID=143495 RepID=UPI002E1B619C|nr:hypothetical protein [Aneurinibacillus thermoaerophilus]MED0681195.1 hypothetical protein [Aneurinibacillus thermoaerophilus]MED0735435.1 hypothetical protein [Aneurinibacillus thermoaerophilus]MED0763553.1 hypothetical protein [Aneurinibacillus thermoaerophilus]